MNIKPMTTLGEVCDHFRQKAVAFDYILTDPGCDSWINHALIMEFARIGPEARQVTINEEEEDLRFPDDTLVVVEKNRIWWEHKGSLHEMRFYRAEPMEIA